MVVETSLCPNNSCTVRISYLFSSKVGSKTVANRVTTGGFFHARRTNGEPDCILEVFLGYVVPPDFAQEQ